MFVARYWRTKSHLYKLTGVRNADGQISIVPRPEGDVDRVEFDTTSEKHDRVMVVASSRK
jgi:hypothetical protein